MNTFEHEDEYRYGCDETHCPIWGAWFRMHPLPYAITNMLTGANETKKEARRL